MTLPEFDLEKLSHSPWAMGALGSLTAVVRSTPGTTLAEKVFNGLAGSAIAGVGAPALCEWLKVTSPNYLSIAALILGLVGMSLCDQLLKAAKETPLGKFLGDWLDRFSPKKEG